MERAEREKAIAILQKERKTALHDNVWAFDYAIASLKTDLKYDLMYEGWIPINQVLPKENARVLFYCEKEVSYDEYTGDILDWWVQEGSYSKKYGFFVYGSPDIGRGIDKKYVIAWAPLPQPYRVKGEKHE